MDAESIHCHIFQRLPENVDTEKLGHRKWRNDKKLVQKHAGTGKSRKLNIAYQKLRSL